MNKPTRHFSKQQEEFVASTLQGKVIANSGATPFHKGDLKFPLRTDEESPLEILVECKTKTKEQKTISIKKEWLEEVKREAISENYLSSALVVDFGEEKKTNTNQYIIMSLADFQTILMFMED